MNFDHIHSSPPIPPRPTPLPYPPNSYALFLLKSVEVCLCCPYIFVCVSSSIVIPELWEEGV